VKNYEGMKCCHGKIFRDALRCRGTEEKTGILEMSFCFMNWNYLLFRKCDEEYNSFLISYHGSQTCFLDASCWATHKGVQMYKS
jgi:hypothetical protein